MWGWQETILNTDRSFGSYLCLSKSLYQKMMNAWIGMVLEVSYLLHSDIFTSCIPNVQDVNGVCDYLSFSTKEFLESCGAWRGKDEHLKWGGKFWYVGETAFFSTIKDSGSSGRGLKFLKEDTLRALSTCSRIHKVKNWRKERTKRR